MKENKGERPLGDGGQIGLFVLFLIVWILDSFMLKLSASTTSLFYLAIPMVIVLLSIYGCQGDDSERKTVPFV